MVKCLHCQIEIINQKRLENQLVLFCEAFNRKRELFIIYQMSWGGGGSERVSVRK